MSNGATTFRPKVQVESIQTVVPVKPTDRKTSRVWVPQNLRQLIFQKRIHVILYYKKTLEGDHSGWVTGGWIKETLGTALVEQPMLSGRLRQLEDGDGVGELEIVSNDSGVRFFESRISMNLVELLDMKKEIRDELEVDLVVWKDINEQSPMFSPLCYVQVTNFSCGGYSIGFSCSLLVMDPFTFTNFLKQWANIHNTIISKPEIPKLPIFYLPSLGKNGNSNAIVNTPLLHPEDKGIILIFKDGSSKNLISDVALYIEELEKKLGFKTGPDFTLIVKEVSGEINAKRVIREGIVMKPNDDVVSKGLVWETWDSLRGDEIILQKGNKPVCVSYWINSIVDQLFVMAIPSLGEGTSGTAIIVTIPNEK